MLNPSRPRCRSLPLGRFFFATLAAVFAFASNTAFAQVADVALVVVYDTSGSMRSPIRTQGGSLEAKHVVAKRAFSAVIDRLERFTKPSADASATSPAKRLDLAIVIFSGSRAQVALPMAPLNGDATRKWLSALATPDSGTPLGDAIAQAGRILNATPALSKHLLVLTDGENTTGISPHAAVKALQKPEPSHPTPVFVHVLALDISPSVFSALQKAGATLVGAADEKQLQSQLDFILENQILVEAP
ncbi:MAG: VWA domain-containing protein [Rariglobus sp.]